MQNLAILWTERKRRNAAFALQYAAGHGNIKTGSIAEVVELADTPS
jgi:hypothetical protein